MSYVRRLLPVAVLVTALPLVAAAQGPSAVAATPDTAAIADTAVSVSSTTSGAPTLAASAVAAREFSPEIAGAALQQRARSTTKPVALMVVGGAAIIVGSVIGQEAGSLFMIGGAVALLYGLYLYLQQP